MKRKAGYTPFSDGKATHQSLNNGRHREIMVFYSALSHYTILTSTCDLPNPLVFQVLVCHADLSIYQPNGRSPDVPSTLSEDSVMNSYKGGKYCVQERRQLRTVVEHGSEENEWETNAAAAWYTAAG